MNDSFQPERGDRNRLSMDEKYILENQVLPMARRWLDKPGLRDHGLSTLAHWGEPIPAGYAPKRFGGAG